MDQFEDNPVEPIRLDLSLGSSSVGTSTDVLKGLVVSGHKSETTEIVGTWTEMGLAEYNANKGGRRMHGRRRIMLFVC